MQKLLRLAKNPWLLVGAGILSTYALAGFLLIPFLVRHYTPTLVAEQINRQASVGAVRFNPFLLTFEAEDFVLKEADSQPIFSLRHARADFEWESLYRRAWVFGDLVLEGPQVNVVMDNQGKLNLARLADSLPNSDEPPPPSPPPRFLLKHLTLKDGAVAYTRQAGTETLSPLNLELDDISTLPDSNGILALDAQLDGGGAVHWDGRFTLEPIQAEGDFRLEGFNLASAWKLVNDWLNLAEPAGTLALSAHYRFELRQDTMELALSKLGFGIAKLRLALAGAAEPMLDLDDIRLERAEFDLASRKIKLPSFTIKNGRAKIAVDGQGNMNWQSLMKAQPEVTPPTPAEPPATEEAPWRVELGAFKLADIGIGYANASSRVPYAASMGRFGLDLAAKAEVGAGGPKLGIHGIKLAIQDLQIAETGPDAAPDPLLMLGNIRLDEAEFDLETRTVKLPSWVIEKGLAQVAVDEQGGLNWQHLAQPEKPDSPPAADEPAKDAAAKQEAPWRLELSAFKLAELGVRYADASRKQPYAASLGDVRLDFAVKTEVGPGEPRAHVDGLNVAIKDIQLSADGHSAPLLGWDSLEVGGGHLDLEKRELGIDRIALTGGGTQIQREADGTVSLAEVFAPKAEAKTVAEPPATAGKTAATPPWHVTLKGFALQGFRLAYTDHTFSPAIAYEADSIDVNLGKLGYPGNNPFDFDAKLRLTQGGTLMLSGKASPAGDSADAKVQADQINLSPLQPVVSKFAKLKLDNADFSSNLQVGFRQNVTGPAVKAAGSLGLGRLLLKEAVGGQRLLSWKNLAVNGIDFGINPDRLTIKEVRILEPGTKIAIAKDKTNNFTSAFKAQPASSPATARDAALDKNGKPQQAPAPASPKPFPVKVERVRVENGVIDFSDLSLVIPFATRVHDFDGMATDISTAPNSRTRLKFAGRVEEFGEAKVDGTIIPSAFKTFSDIDVVFRNVEMSSLSPYSATFAGRKITSGKLNLDLLYKIENSQLKSENKILLEKFTLGEQVESPGAISLPLDFAIALLKDGEGKINANVPIEGNVDNPQFAYGPLIWDAFVTLVKTAATAPFRALGSLLGADEGEDLGAVLFPPGTGAIPPPEREKIQKVAKALAQRPKVKLTVQGGFDAKLDGEALRTLRIRQAVARQLGEESGDADPGPLSFSDAKTQKALEDLAVQRGGEGFLDAVQAEFEKTAGRKPSRFLGVPALVGRASEDADFYQQAFRHLVEAEPLPDKELEKLADQRTQAVLKELAGQPDFDAGRVAAGKTGSVSDNKDGNVPTRLELGAQE